MGFSLPHRIVFSTVLLNTMFFIPVAVLYYQYKGIALGDIFQLLAIYRLLMMAFEVPAGYLADRWQRHHQLMAAGALIVVTFLGIFAATGYWMMLAAFAIAAFADAMHSGTKEAYLHEALRNAGQERDAPKWQGYLFAAGLVAEGLAALLGGWLYGQWVHAPMVLTIATATLGFALTFTFPKVPRLAEERRHDHPLEDLKAVLRWSLREHPRLPYLIIAPRLMFALTGTLFWAMQARLTELQLSPLWLGIALTGYFVVKTAGAVFVDKLHVRTGESTLLLGIAAMLIGGTVMLAMGANPLVVWIGSVISAGLVHAMGQPLATSLINHEVSDRERATVLSAASLISGLYGGLLMLAVDPLLKFTSFENTVLLCLGATTVLAAYPFYRLLRSRA